jgi:hypothetical protein
MKVALVLVALAAVRSSAAGHLRKLTDEEKKVKICHCTARRKQGDDLRGPIKTWDCFLIEIAQSAVDKHLDNHDPDHTDSLSYREATCTTGQGDSFEGNGGGDKVCCSLTGGE